MDNRDIRETDFITLYEAASLTGKTIHPHRKAVKTRPIRYHDDVRNGRRVLVMSRLDLLKYYKSVDQMVSRLEEQSPVNQKQFKDIDMLMENVLIYRDVTG